MNNDFGVTSASMRFANYFHEWRSHEWKSLANRITSDPKIVIDGNEGIILFLIIQSLRRLEYIRALKYESYQTKATCKQSGAVW